MTLDPATNHVFVYDFSDATRATLERVGAEDFARACVAESDLPKVHIDRSISV
jgi:hypothetical protein